LIHNHDQKNLDEPNCTELEGINIKVELIAKWLECLGFLVTIFTLIKVIFLDKRVEKLQAQHLFQVRINDHLKELKSTSINTANLLDQILPNIKEIRIEVNQCRINCMSLKKKTDGEKLISLKKLIKISNSIIKNKIEVGKIPNWWEMLWGHRPVQERDVDEFYETLTSLIAEIEQLNKDLRKSII
jgi:hypothetical protein